MILQQKRAGPDIKVDPAEVAAVMSDSTYR